MSDLEGGWVRLRTDPKNNCESFQNNYSYEGRIGAEHPLMGKGGEGDVWRGGQIRGGELAALRQLGRMTGAA